MTFKKQSILQDIWGRSEMEVKRTKNAIKSEECTCDDTLSIKHISQEWFTACPSLPLLFFFSTIPSQTYPYLPANFPLLFTTLSKSSFSLSGESRGPFLLISCFTLYMHITENLSWVFFFFFSLSKGCII